MKLIGLTKIEKLKMIGLMVKSVTAIVGGSLILSTDHPYLSLSILALGGAANEFVSVIKEKENEAIINGLKENKEGNENEDSDEQTV